MRVEELRYASSVAWAKSLDSTRGKICGCHSPLKQGAVIFRGDLGKAEVIACGARSDRMSPEQNAIAALRRMGRLHEARSLDLLHVDAQAGSLCDTDPRNSIEGAFLIYGYRFRGIWFYYSEAFHFIPSRVFYDISRS